MAGRWPGPVRRPDRALVRVLVGAAAIGAVSIPLDRPGSGWSIAAIAAAASLAVASRRTGSREQAGWDRGRLGHLFWAVAAVALVAIGAVRSAGWLFVLCLLAAAVSGALSLTGGRSVRGLLIGVLLPPAAAVRALPWVFAGRGRPDRGRFGRAVLTAAVSVVLLVVFGALFAGADAAFAELLGSWLATVSPGTAVRWSVLFALIGAGLVGGAYLLAAPPDLSAMDRPAGRRLGRVEWVVPVALLDLLFALFVLVQLTVLFGGSEHVLRTAGLTYAEYARRGFWQLLAVTALTLLVIAGAGRWAPRAGRVDRLLIRGLLGALALLTLVVVASASYRMNVYTQAYGATRLRLLVAACEVWLGLVFVLVLAAGARLRGAWLPRAALAAAVLALLGLAVANPDRLIADRNVDRYERTGRLDLRYLSRLSPDAVPAIERLSGRLRACGLRNISISLADRADDWRTVNLARARARSATAGQVDRLTAAECLPVLDRQVP